MADTCHFPKRYVTERTKFVFEHSTRQSPLTTVWTLVAAVVSPSAPRQCTSSALRAPGSPHVTSLVSAQGPGPATTPGAGAFRAAHSEKRQFPRAARRRLDVAGRESRLRLQSRLPSGCRSAAAPIAHGGPAFSHKSSKPQCRAPKPPSTVFAVRSSLQISRTR